MIRQRHKIILILLLIASHQVPLHTAEEKELIMCFKDGRQETLTGTLRQNVIGASRTVSDLLEDKTVLESQTALPLLLPIISANFNKSVRPVLVSLGQGSTITNKARKKIAAASANDLRELIKVNSILQFTRVSEEVAQSFLSKERVAQFIKQLAAFARDIASFEHELDVVYDLVQNITKCCSFAFAAPKPLPIYTDHLVLSPDGTKLVGQSGDHMTKVFDIKENIIGPVYEIDSTSSTIWNKSGTHCAFINDNALTIFDASQLQRIGKYVASGGKWVLSWNGSHIACAERTVFMWDTIELYDIAQGQPVRRLHNHPIHFIFKVSWSHSNGKIASLSYDGTMRIWDPENETQLICGQFPSPNDQPNKTKHDFTCLKWSPDDSQIAYYCRERRAVYIWDTASGQLLHTLKTGEVVLSLEQYAGRYGLTYQYLMDRGVCSFAWSPCGAMLVTSASDNTLLVWDTAIGKIINTIKLPDDDKRSFVSVDWGANNMLVVATNDCAVYAFDMNNVEKLSEIMKSKISISQAMLLAHILKYDTAFGAKWLNRLKSEGQASTASSSKSKSKQSQEEKNEDHLLGLLYSMPIELKDGLKQWLATGFVIQKPQE